MTAVRAACILGAGTFVEAMRSRLLWISVIFAAVLVLMSLSAASVAVFEQERFIIDVGLAAASGMGGVIALAASIAFLANELQGRTAYVVLARPLPRWAYIVGKFLGLWAAMIVVVLAMGVSTAGVVKLFSGDLSDAFWPAVGLTCIEMAVVVAVGLLFAALAVPALAATYAAGLWLAGNLSTDILALSERQKEPLARTTLQIIHAILPDLSTLSLRSQAANNLPVPDGYALRAIVYGLSYAAVAITLGALVFTRRRAI